MKRTTERFVLNPSKILLSVFFGGFSLAHPSSCFPQQSIGQANDKQANGTVPDRRSVQVSNEEVELPFQKARWSAVLPLAGPVVVCLQPHCSLVVVWLSGSSCIVLVVLDQLQPGWYIQTNASTPISCLALPVL